MRRSKRPAGRQPEANASRDEAVNLAQSLGIQKRQQLGEQNRALYPGSVSSARLVAAAGSAQRRSEIYQARFSQVLTESQLRSLELTACSAPARCARCSHWKSKISRAGRSAHDLTNERAGIPHLLDWSNAFYCQPLSIKLFSRHAVCRRRVGDVKTLPRRSGTWRATPG